MMQSQHTVNSNRDLIDEDLSQDIEMADQSQPIQSLEDSYQLNEENQRQMLRLIQQYLIDHGFQDVASDLQVKSKVRMEEPVMNEFRQSVLNGEFSKARSLLSSFQNISKTKRIEIEYSLYEQEYFEMIEARRKVEAILLLQRELMPRVVDEQGRNRLHQLAQLIMCGNQQNISDELKSLVQWSGSDASGRKDLLERIQMQMPSSEMLKPARLENLVKKAVAFQIVNCKYHNVGTMTGTFSLLENHYCEKKSMIPNKCIGVISKYKDEVWQVKFSASGKRFASIGRDGILYIWSLKKVLVKNSSSAIKQEFAAVQTKYKVKCTHEIRGHSKQVNCINWSTDVQCDRWIVTASADNTAKVWDVKLGKLAVDITRHNEQVHSAAFIPGNDYRLLTSAVDKLIILWEIKQQSQSLLPNLANGEPSYEIIELARIETRNFLDIAVSSSRIVAMGNDHISVYNLPSNGQTLNSYKQALEDPELTYEIDVKDTVTSMALSKDGRQLLCNVSFKQPRLELYDLGDHPKRARLIRKYKGGHEQTQYVLKCAFGGAAEAFVLCGSEDATTTIWHKELGQIIAKIGENVENSHTQAINCVSWSPIDPLLFITASDDQSMRLWLVEGAQPCEIQLNPSDMKKIDLIRPPGSVIARDNTLSDGDDEEDEELEDDDEESGSEDEEEDEAMEEEDLYNFSGAQGVGSSLHQAILQSSREPHSGIREEDSEQEEEEQQQQRPRNQGDEDWAEGGGPGSFA